MCNSSLSCGGPLFCIKLAWVRLLMKDSLITCLEYSCSVFVLSAIYNHWLYRWSFVRLNRLLVCKVQWVKGPRKTQRKDFLMLKYFSTQKPVENWWTTKIGAQKNCNKPSVWLMNPQYASWIQEIPQLLDRFCGNNFLFVCVIVGYDMSTFIRRYSKYLNEKAVSYRQMAFDFCKVKRGYVWTKPFHQV